MTLLAPGIASRRPLKFMTCSAAALGLALLIGALPIANREAVATTSVGVAARNADADLNSCGKNTGTALYGCVADVLNRFCYATGRGGLPVATKQTFDGAIGRLRRAVNKVEALSALAQARSAIAGALQQARGTGRAEGGSADAGDFQAISALLSHAAQLIQAKG
jgi:hypothetical protein